MSNFPGNYVFVELGPLIMPATFLHSGLIMTLYHYFLPIPIFLTFDVFEYVLSLENIENSLIKKI